MYLNAYISFLTPKLIYQAVDILHPRDFLPRSRWKKPFTKICRFILSYRFRLEKKKVSGLKDVFYFDILANVLTNKNANFRRRKRRSHTIKFQITSVFSSSSEEEQGEAGEKQSGKGSGKRVYQVVLLTLTDFILKK